MRITSFPRAFQALLLLAALTPSARAAVWYVRAGAPVGGNGRSWATAMMAVQPAVDAASPGDEVWVAGGHYSSADTIQLRNRVSLYGGFAGREARRDARDPDANPTVLDGPYRHGNPRVKAAAGGSVETVLDGFVIRNGWVGVWVFSGALTIANNLITQNVGFAIRSDTATLVIRNNTVTRNRGRGIFVVRSQADVTNNAVTLNVLFTNDAYSGPLAGGIYCWGSEVRVAGNLVCGNSSGTFNEYGFCGGILLMAGSAGPVTGNVVKGNNAQAGGGIDVRDARCDVVGNVIAGNSAASDGAGLMIGPGTGLVANNTIVDNRAAGEGGAIFASGGGAVIVNNIIAANSSGVMAAYGANPTFRNNCFFQNGTYEVRGAASPIGASGNIDADPRFGSLRYGNLHIRPNSPCRDAGLSDVVSSGDRDMDGQPRVMHGRVDIGADESDGATWSESPTVVRVSPTGSDEADGSSWASAKRTIGAATMDLAVSGGEVWASGGVYPERITLLPFVHLYGGFRGSERRLDQRDWDRNRTVLDGEQAGTVVTVRGSSYATLDGFTVRNGAYAYSFENGTYEIGGGISCLRTGVRIENNRIEGNQSNGSGAGIFCDFGSGPVVIRNRISGNTTTSPGGGVYCHRRCTAEFKDNVITGNSAGNGGGVYLFNATPVFANNTVVGNTALDGGGVVAAVNIGEAPAILVNSIIAFNTSGILGSNGSPASPVLQHCCVYGNAGYDFKNMPDPTGAQGDIAADPRFTDLEHGDFHVHPGSPCRNAGTNAPVTPGETDMDGEPRILGQRVDIGADEVHGGYRPARLVVLRVAPWGSDTSSGAAWNHAKQTIQAAMDAMPDSGGEIWVANGVYREPVVFRPYVGLYGGFAGSERARGARNLSAHSTILDGGGTVRPVTIPPAASSAILDGFTIRNGSAENGGAIECAAVSARIAHNVIENNTATVPTGRGSMYGGGGVRTLGGSALISNNVFTGNSTQSVGGAIHAVWTILTFTNNTVVRNRAPGGAGVYLTATENPVVANNIIAWNEGDGLAGNTYGPATVVANGFFENTRADIGPYLTQYLGVNGNIQADPLFVSLPAGDYHLRPDSSYRDQGLSAYVSRDDVDLDGSPRLQGAAPDMGAFELSPVATRRPSRGPAPRDHNPRPRGRFPSPIGPLPPRSGAPAPWQIGASPSRSRPLNGRSNLAKPPEAWYTESS
jgi:parallel beta-helix repeat protein